MQPYLSLCVIFRNNVDTLPALLESVKGKFDEYVFVDTGSTDGSRDLVRSALGGGSLYDFEWCDDFAAARNFSFEMATGRWRMFLDSDDVLVGDPKTFLMGLEARNPVVEALFVPYVYDRLERLDTMRLVRWRDGWRWNDAIHERLEFEYPNGDKLPADCFGRTTSISVKHKPKSPEEKAAALRRNARIARKEYEAATGAYRARLGRTIAMELKLDGKMLDTIPLNEALWATYPDFPEGHQAAAEIAKAHLFLNGKDGSGDLDAALLWAKRAGPAYEAIVHHVRGEYDACLKAVQRSSARGPQTTHEGLLFEQAACYVAAADSARCLKMGPDVIDNLLNHIPAELRNDESVSAHVNSLRREVDRITIVVPGTPQPFDENGGSGMLGGSEEAVVYLTRALAGLGRNVRVFAPLPPHRVPGKDRFGVDWQSIKTFEQRLDDEHGTLVIWRAPALMLQLAGAAQQRGYLFGGIAQAFLWLHDSGLGLASQDAAAVGNVCEGAVVLSEFHAKMVQRNGYKGPLHFASNGIVEDDFDQYIDGAAFGTYDECPSCPYTGRQNEPDLAHRDPNRVVYSSCPSRGLVPLLEMWPRVKAECPQAYLDIYYDWSMLERMQPALYARVVKAYEAVKHLDVKHHGGVSHEELHAALRGANVWAYSHFESTEVETFCISAVKALAAGATVLTVPNGALREVTAGDATFCMSTESYAATLIAMLKNPVSVKVRREKARRALERYGWGKVAQKFSGIWTVSNRIRSVLKPLDATESGTMLAT